MKSILLITGLLIAAVTFGQQDDTKEKLSTEERAEKKTEQMAKKLGLDEAQKSQILALNLKFIEEQEVKKAEVKKLKEEMKASRESNKAQLESILTAEQKTKLDAMEAERKEKRKEKKGTKKRS